MVCEEAQVAFELVQQAVHLARVDLDYEGLGAADVLSRNHQVIAGRHYDFNGVGSVTQVVLTHVECLSLHNLADLLVHAPTPPWVLAPRRVTSLLRVHAGAAGPSARVVRAILFLDDEVSRPLGRQRSRIFGRLAEQLVWILADVLYDPASVVVLDRPPGHIVVRLLLLQAFQDEGVLLGDLAELSVAGLPVQTFGAPGQGADARGLEAVCAGGLHDAGLVRVGDADWILQNVGHLLEEDAVLTLNFSVTLFQHLVLLGLRPQVDVLLRRDLRVHSRLDIPKFF